MPSMLTQKMREVLDRAAADGWVTEPDAKAFLKEAGLAVPEFARAADFTEAAAAAKKIGYPVAAKVVSPKIVHKSDAGGVAVGIEDEAALRRVYDRFSAMDGFVEMLVEEMAAGVELIVGAKVDYQFGPVILFGIGGTAVEIYEDVAIRMAPLGPHDVSAMVDRLTGKRMLQGFRGAKPVDMAALTRTLVVFSQLAMETADVVESIDLNPVMCSEGACVIADARIMLAK